MKRKQKRNTCCLPNVFLQPSLWRETRTSQYSQGTVDNFNGCLNVTDSFIDEHLIKSQQYAQFYR